MTTTPCPPALASLGQRLVMASAVVVRRHFRRPLTVDIKDDDSPVTVADREAEAAIRAILRAERPDDGIIGEEHGAERDDAEYVWVIDPIDGTRAFITGRPTFGTLVACLRDGVPILGVINQPIIDDTWVGAAGQPTRLNGDTVTTRPCAALNMAMLSTTTPDSMDTDEEQAFQALKERTRDTTYGGDCYAYGLLASGFIDIVVDCSMQLYDFAALVPVVAGAGGAMSDWSGVPLTRNSGSRVLASGSAALHNATLSVLAQA